MALVKVSAFVVLPCCWKCCIPLEDSLFSSQLASFHNFDTVRLVSQNPWMMWAPVAHLAWEKLQRNVACELPSARAECQTGCHIQDLLCCILAGAEDYSFYPAWQLKWDFFEHTVSLSMSSTPVLLCPPSSFWNHCPNQSDWQKTPFWGSLPWKYKFLVNSLLKEIKNNNLPPNDIQKHFRPSLWSLVSSDILLSQLCSMWWSLSLLPLSMSMSKTINVE